MVDGVLCWLDTELSELSGVSDPSDLSDLYEPS